MEQGEAWNPTASVAHRVREVRKRRGMTAQDLADKLAEHGVPWERSTVAKLENGNRQNLTLTEWLALSVVLNVAPVHLLVPPYPSPQWDRPAGERNDPNDEAPFQVTPELATPLYRVRRFVRGSTPLPGGDRRGFYSEIPPQEFDPLVQEEVPDGPSLD
ncbi:helix-turn-helix transcriptional regulator [Streptomyces sp. NPDC057137]|uniref:helix-turn-helix transcriptional regulator n=1 Tax=Streptomyces sp. NPDC057137 TaxID=3346030 RepID=UPI00362DE8D9